MIRAAVIALALCAAAPALAGGAATVGAARYVFKAGGYTKVGRLVALHADDLKHATRGENIDGLLSLAQVENRVDAVEASQINARFNAVGHGDVLLLTCLRVRQCVPTAFLAVTERSALHAEVISRNPDWSPTKVDQAVGAISEQVMNRYFQGTGWRQVPGQTGRRGFDGLYVKQEGGVVKEVLIAESKYNTSALKGTAHGTQMSEDWVRRKLVELQARYPGENIYRQIDRFAENGVYRAVLWHLRVDDEALHVTISKVKSKEGSIQIAEAAGTDVEELWTRSTQTVQLAAPQNRFEKDLVKWYGEALDEVAGK